MKMPDVNILMYAYRQESERHAHYFEWLTKLVESKEPFGLSTLVLSGFVRIVTNKKIFKPARSLEDALLFINQLLEQPNAVVINPGGNHWPIFSELLEETKSTGKLVADAQHAAIAIENGCSWVTADTDFVRFEKKLRWELL